MSAPNVLTEEILTTRSAVPMVMVQSEEILKTRTPAYTGVGGSVSDISFLVRQPSASAILKNAPELYLELEFKADKKLMAMADFHKPDAEGNDAQCIYADATSDVGFWPEMLPLQNKCIRNMVITINGASQSIRCNEFGVPYCKMHCSREYMEKIGGGINNWTTRACFKRSEAKNEYTYALDSTAALQLAKWKNQMLQDRAEEKQDKDETPRFIFREPLYCGVFGAFSSAESFPAWSAESQKPAGLLHVHNMQIQCAMEEGWWRSLYLGIRNNDKNEDDKLHAKITGVEVRTAELLCEWVQPPPRLVGSAIGAQVSYATSDVLRFVADYKSSNGSDILKPGESGQFELNAVSYPYMPNLFVFEIAPDYAHKAAFIGRTDSWGGGALFDSKKDARIAITHMELIVNTSNAAVPFKGAGGTQSARVNAYDLYKMTLANCFSMERFPHSFEDWLQGGAFVALTPAQMNGVLASPSIRGNVTVQGTIHVKNMTNLPVNCGKDNTLTFTGGTNCAGRGWPRGGNLERYQCICSGMYSNRVLTLDAKSGLVSENTFSEAFSQSLRLGTRAS